MDTTPQTNTEPKPSNDLPAGYYPYLNGIKGWLIVVVIGRILTIILGVKDITDSLPLLGERADFDAILYSAIAIDIVFGIILSVIILVLMFMKNIAFRILFVIQATVSFLFIIIVLIYFSSLGFDVFSSFSTQLLISIAGGIIWIIYLYNSDRVKSTYIYPKMINR